MSTQLVKIHACVCAIGHAALLWQAITDWRINLGYYRLVFGFEATTACESRNSSLAIDFGRPADILGT